ncbi:MAG: sodium:solute symporter family protein [Brevinematia bacterium]
MIYLFLYFLCVLGVILAFSRKFVKVGSEEYTVYGRRGGVFEIAMSLVALVFGASSVFGLAGWGYKLGWNAIWWTLSGVIFLVVLGIFFAKVIYSLRGVTIIDVIEGNYGRAIRGLSSFVLLVAWISVLAGQIIAGGNITQIVVGDKILSFIVFALIFGIYTFVWGQVGAIKTSFLQVLLMVVGIGLIFYLVFSKAGYSPKLLMNAEFGISEKFSLSLLLTVFTSVGLSYLFGPDIYSRIFSSKDSSIARKAVLLSAFLILVISFFIVAVGVLSRAVFSNVENPDNIIPIFSLSLVPEEAKPLVLVALISIPLSGADVILVTATAVLSRNLLPSIFGEKRIFENVWFIRVVSALVILVATVVAVFGKGIIPTLLIAYKVFSSTVAPIVFSSLLIKLLRREVVIPKSRKILMFSLLSVTTLYILLCEILPFLQIPNYTLYVLFINTVVSLIATFWRVREGHIGIFSVERK